MGTSSNAAGDLHGILKRLCFNSAWKYAVFWKLKHRDRMVLTWEDGYYDNCKQRYSSLENTCSSETIENLHAGSYSHDPLGLAIAKMSYHVYSLGEGIVGQVAVTGNHQWIFSDQHDTSSNSSFEFCDGWQSQFSAGIKTIVVVAVVPDGVVQLGSLNKIPKDLKSVTRIKDVFVAVNDVSVAQVSSRMQYNMKNILYVPDLPTMSLASEIIPSQHKLCEIVIKEGSDVQLPMFHHIEKHNDGSYFYPLSGVQPKIVDGVVNKNEGIQLPTAGSDGSAKILHPKSHVMNLDHQNEMGIYLISDGMSKGESSGLKDLGMESEQNVTPSSINPVIDSRNLCNVALQAEKFVVGCTNFPSNPLESVFDDQVELECMDSYQDGILHIPQISDMKFQKDLEKLQNQTDLNHLGLSEVALKFPAVSELHKALGPAFLKKDADNDRKPENTADGESVVMSEVMSSSHLMFDSGSENLLDAVVASVCHSGSDLKSERSLCKSVHSLLTTEKKSEPSSQSKNTINSVTYSINQSSLVEEDSKQCMSSSELCGAMSSKEFSSTCPSTCCEQMDRSSEPTKNNKKRARTGENGRPRPRDRQLIQDRIKELRELVPNGSKCSIDSLLERTVKHMLFLQSVSKHADKLSKCAESKMHQKGTSIQGSHYEQGSSWAVEVGSHLKVCSIIVENLNKNGQMLVEMLCEECHHFLEIAEAIRSLGLTILKGVTEAHGDKTWICFVVEGQDNRTMHRMDVLWSLVQVLQTKTKDS